MDIEKLDLLHRVFLAAGPKMDQEMLKNLMLVLTIFTERDTGEQLRKTIRQM